MTKGLLLVVAALGAVAFTGCVADGGGPSPSPSVSSKWPERDVEDDVTMVPPPGWELVTDPAVLSQARWELIVIPEGGDVSERRGVRGLASPARVLRDALPREWVDDPARRRDAWAEDAQQRGASIEVLPDRVFDGETAYGYLAVGEEFDGVAIPYEEWIVRRADGIWHFVVWGEPGTDRVPQDLSASLDTVRWSIPS